MEAEGVGLQAVLDHERPAGCSRLRSPARVVVLVAAQASMVVRRAFTPPSTSPPLLAVPSLQAQLGTLLVQLISTNYEYLFG